MQRLTSPRCVVAERELELRCADEHWDEYSDSVKLEITDELKNLVRPAAAWLTANIGYWRVSAFDYRFDDWGVTCDCQEIHISTDTVYWTALVKHTNIELMTEPVKVMEILNGKVG